MNRPGHVNHWQHPKNHEATPASGGKLLRRYRRNAEATRDVAPARRHGAYGQSPNFMRPPGSGSVDYQDPNGKRAPRLYSGTGVDPVAAALAAGLADG